MRASWGQGVHRLADPKITLASAASLLVGAAAAARAGPVEWGWLVVTIAGIFCVETAKNASGELVDFDSGADGGVAPEDRSPFSGGKRVLVDGLLSRRETAAVAAVGYGAVIAIGLWITFAREPRVLWLGLAGVLLAWFYHAAPLRLSYRGLGEAAVALTYGPLIACGVDLVQRGAIGRDALLLSIPLGILVAAFLWINEFPDYRSDLAAGKRTLVVRLGRRAASRAFAALIAVAFAGLVAIAATTGPPLVLLGLAGLPHAVVAARRLARDPEVTARIVPAQAWALLSFTLYAVGVAAGLGLAPGAVR